MGKGQLFFSFFGLFPRNGAERVTSAKWLNSVPCSYPPSITIWTSTHSQVLLWELWEPTPYAKGTERGIYPSVHWLISIQTLVLVVDPAVAHELPPVIVL